MPSQNHELFPVTKNPYNPYDSDADFEEWIKFERRPRKLLVIDDDKPMHLLVANALSAYRCNIYSAFTGEEGVEKCMEIRPNVIWLDCMLGKMDGVEVFSEIRRRERLIYQSEELTPVIFVSQQLSQDMISRISREGVALLLQKPDDLRDKKLREVFAHFHIPRKPRPVPASKIP